MSVNFKIKMTPLTLYSYLLHQNFTTMKGILGVIVGVGILLTGMKQTQAGSTLSAALLMAAGIIIVGIPFVLLWKKAVKEVDNTSAYETPLRYELSDAGVKVVHGEGENLYLWDQFLSAVSTGQALVLTLDDQKTVIFPRAQIGEKWAPAVQVISTHMPPDKVRIRQVN